MTRATIAWHLERSFVQNTVAPEEVRNKTAIKSIENMVYDVGNIEDVSGHFKVSFSYAEDVSGHFHIA